jgi:hypothetical protein
MASRVHSTNVMRANTACRWAMLIGALALNACAGRLQPAATAQLAPGEPKAAIATVEGVTVVARPNAWRGFPSDLDRQVTPILITIRNERAQLVSVKSGETALMAASGRRFAAIPPQAVEGTVEEPVSALPVSVGGFYGTAEFDGRVLDPWYRSGPWQPGAPFGWDTRYDGPSYASVRLPTRDMLALALPDAPIRPGEIAQGFVYFERVGPKGTSVDLVLPLLDAGSGQRLGEVSIPFVFQ